MTKIGGSGSESTLKCHGPKHYFLKPELSSFLSEILKDHLKPGMRALDVGSGSGYLTACMALMVGSRGKVVGIGKHH
jgi:protein-L-isoaspartate O-methyltransferase